MTRWSALRPRIHTCLAAILWAIRVELVIRRRRVDQLAAMAGIRFETGQVPAPLPDRPSLRDPVISPADLQTLRLVSRLYRPFSYRGTCLRESLVAGRLLRYRAPVLRIGVQSGLSGMRAHAWLEFGGVAIDPSAGAYTPLTGR